MRTQVIPSACQHARRKVYCTTLTLGPRDKLAGNILGQNGWPDPHFASIPHEGMTKLLRILALWRMAHFFF
jgi:hypothetical protein